MWETEYKIKELVASVRLKSIEIKAKYPRIQGENIRFWWTFDQRVNMDHPVLILQHWERYLGTLLI